MTPLELLQQLIQIPSVNPMGQRANKTIAYEARLSEFLLDLFRKRGIACESLEVAPQRMNVIARVDGAEDAPILLLDAHQDTVPVDEMTIAPFTPQVHEGRVWGRGACDVKGGMAAMICALDRLNKEANGRRPTVILTCSCDEEFSQLGAIGIARLLRSPDASHSQLLSDRPRMAIVAEPTELEVAVAHRGVVRWSVRVAGRSAHSSDPSKGRNAIYRMARLVTALEKYAESLSAAKPHPICGSRTLSVGVISGGESVNIVPSQCSIEIDRRTLPGETPQQVIADVDQFLSERLDFEFEMLPATTVSSPLVDGDNLPLANRLAQAANSVRQSDRLIGLPFGTHAPRYAEVGIPCVVFGPGSILQAHTKDEWIDIEQVNLASEILFRFLTSFEISS